MLFREGWVSSPSMAVVGDKRSVRDDGMGDCSFQLAGDEDY